MDIPASRRDYLKLHGLVVLAGFTAILGTLIELPSATLVFWRTLVAAAALGVLLAVSGAGDRLRWRDRLALWANGLLIGVHWFLFFLAVKISNVSVCMVGMATMALWSGAIEPLAGRRPPPSLGECFLGVLVVAGMGLIFGGGFEFGAGLAVAVGAALAAAVFSTFNSVLVRHHHHWQVAFYGMVGACSLCAVGLGFEDLLEPDATRRFWPSGSDWVYLLILAFACTVYAYTQYVELLKRMSVFAISVAFNLEPLYGIALAALFFQEFQEMGPAFWAGAALILAAVVSHPFLQQRVRRGA